MIRTYTELMKLKTFEERFEYLKLFGRVGEETFGSFRYLNQSFYRSDLWRKQIRPAIIVRDNGCDLACPGFDIYGKIIVHHMNPISINDVKGDYDILTNPEYLICVSERTHSAITYGDKNLLDISYIERTPNDTCPWKI